jgi:hypothetical protein
MFKNAKLLNIRDRGLNGEELQHDFKITAGLV